MKVYLDNNVVSAIAKDDTPAESAALDRLVQVYEQAKVELVTSELTLQEIKPYKGTRSIERSTGCSKRYRSLVGTNCWAFTTMATGTLGSVLP